MTVMYFFSSAGSIWCSLPQLCSVCKFFGVTGGLIREYASTPYVGMKRTVPLKQYKTLSSIFNTSVTLRAQKLSQTSMTTNYMSCQNLKSLAKSEGEKPAYE